MCNQFLRGFLSLALIVLCFSCNQQHKKKSKYDKMEELTNMEFERTKDPFLNNIPIQRLVEADEIQNERFAAMSALRSPVPGISWTERGANNVGGRTRAILFDANDAANGYKKVWAGGVGGGLWKTNDITVTNPVWTKINDLFDNLAISAIVQDTANPNTMYFATGEGWFNNDAITGAGIWKTTDGGNTWNRLSSTNTFYFVQDLLIDKDGNLYAAVRLSNNMSGSTGVFRSADGGQTWAAVLDGGNAANNRGGDLELAANGDIYATMGTNFSNGGIYRSSYASHGINTGTRGTFVNITPNPTGTIAAPGNWYHRIELATAPSDANVMYALFQGWNSSDCIAIQQYNAATNSWTLRSVPTIIDQGSNSVFTRGQAWYDLIAAVDPNNANTVFIGGIDALRSTDNGQNWTQISTWSLFAATGFTSAQYVHADHHAITFAPGSSSRALWGTDGGIYYTTNANISGTGNKPTFFAKNTGYNVTQYYSVAAHPTNANFFLAGAQDNGSHRFNAAGLNNVLEVTGGDGGFCHIDQDNPSVMITSYVYNNYYVSTNGGASFTARSLNDRGDFINPTDYDNAANILYAADDAGFMFRWTNPQDNAIDVEDKVALNGITSKISHIAIAPVTSNRLYVGFQNGSVAIIDNAQTGLTLTPTVVRTGAGNVSSIAVDPSNENHVVVTYSNYGVVSVWESNDALSGTPTWTAVEGDLPDMPVRWAVFDPRNSDWLILATELGIWSTNNLDGSNTEWSPTNSGFANTRVDMLQYRASDRTLVAATHGRGLFTAVIPNVTTADINFSASSNTGTEFNSTSDGCRKYKDYSVLMTIANAPVGDATVTLNISNGATATEGFDYDFTTNGNFASPSKTIQFTNGSTDSKTINVRIYDDAQVEGSETFTIQYAISGTTNAQPGIGAQSYSFTISDNDAAPIAFNSSQSTIGSTQYFLGDNNNGRPFNSKLASQKSRMVYRANELTAAGLSAGNISSIGFNLSKQSTRPYQNLQVKLGTTTADYIFDNSVYTNVTMTTVKSVSSYNTVDGWNVFNLDQSFAWNGTDNVVVELCYNNGTADATQLPDLVYGYADGGTDQQASLIWADNTTCTANFSSVNLYYNGVKPQIRIGREVAGTEVVNNLTTVNESLPPLGEVYIYDNAGKVMLRVKNLSTTHDYGCTQFIVDRQGNNAAAFWNNNSANYLMDKTIRIIPANNNPSGSYEITLYYTDAEVTGWENATGQNFNSIQLVKVEGKISDVTPASPDAAGTVSLVSPVVGTLGTNRTLTYTFNNGFSGFGAGVAGAALPISLADFIAKPSGSGVQLNWKTSFEQHSKGFDIERSYDGNTFDKIGFVASKGNTSIGHSYEFYDGSLRQEIVYYRLHQVDLDGRSTYSKVVLVRDNSAAVNGMKILNNPVTDHIDLQFNQPLRGQQPIRITDASGKIIFRTIHYANGEKRLRIPVMSSMNAQGVYVVRVGEFVGKVVRR